MVVGESGRRFGASVAAGAMLGCYGEIGPSTFDTPFGRVLDGDDGLKSPRTAIPERNTASKRAMTVIGLRDRAVVIRPPP